MNSRNVSEKDLEILNAVERFVRICNSFSNRIDNDRDKYILLEIKRNYDLLDRNGDRINFDIKTLSNLYDGITAGLYNIKVKSMVFCV